MRLRGRYHSDLINDRRSYIFIESSKETLIRRAEAAIILSKGG